MSDFLQLHLLTAYPPSNLNRDDLGRPKTCVLAGRTRLRVSSQSLKRAWRKSELFEAALKGHLGTRTREMGWKVFQHLKDGMAEGKARKSAITIAKVFGKMDSKEPKNAEKKDLLLAQLAHISPEEEAAVFALAARLIAENREPTEEEAAVLREQHRAADIALFGRMLADAPKFNTEAAAQVAHALTVHETAVEDDYFSAVDDLNTREEDAGSGFLGELEFGAGVFYLYLCIDRGLLVENLSADRDLARRTLRALTEAAAKVAPTGKQNSFASRARASYILAERGSQQPRSLTVAFLDPVTTGGGKDFLQQAIDKLEEQLGCFDRAYGPTSDARCRISAHPGTDQEVQGFADLLDFVGADLPGEDEG